MELMKLKTYLLSLYLKTTTLQKISLSTCAYTLYRHIHRRVSETPADCLFLYQINSQDRLLFWELVMVNLITIWKRKDYDFCSSVSKVWHEMYEISLSTQTTIKTREFLYSNIFSNIHTKTCVSGWKCTHINMWEGTVKGGLIAWLM